MILKDQEIVCLAQEYSKRHVFENLILKDELLSLASEKKSMALANVAKKISTFDGFNLMFNLNSLFEEVDNNPVNLIITVFATDPTDQSLLVLYKNFLIAWNRELSRLAIHDVNDFAETTFQNRELYPKEVAYSLILSKDDYDQLQREYLNEE